MKFVHPMKWKSGFKLLMVGLFFAFSWSESFGSDDKKPVDSGPVKGKDKAGKESVSAASAMMLAPQLRSELDRAFEELNLNLSAETYVDNMADLKENMSVQVAEARSDASTLFSMLDQGAGAGYVDAVQESDLIRLPVGVKKKLNDGTSVDIGILSVSFGPAVSKVTLFVRLKIKVDDPNSQVKERVLFFGAKDVSFSKRGGLSDEFQAALLGDFIVPFGKWSVVFKGNPDLMNAFPKTDNELNFCRIKVSCNHFSGANLAADIVFPREVIVPFNKTRGVTTDGRVTAKTRFTIGAAGSGDFMASVSFDKPFSLANFQKYGFEIQGASIDLSDVANPPGVGNVQLNNGGVSLGGTSWKGFYLQTFKVLLPQEFRENNAPGEHPSIELGASDVLIDRTGFTGTVLYNNTIPKELNASNWSFTLTKLSLSFQSNEFMNGSFGGVIGLPISSDDPSKRLAYSGIIAPGNKYELTLKTLDNIDFNFVRGTGTLTKGSSVSLMYDDVNKKFKPKAILHGSLNIETGVQTFADNAPAAVPGGDNTVQFRGIVFRNLVLQTDLPKISVGALEYQDNTGKFANFPVSLTKLGFASKGDYGIGSSNPDEVGGIVIGFLINFMDKESAASSSGFAAGCTVVIPFKESANGSGIYRYKPARVKPVGAQIDAVVSSFRIKGAIEYTSDIGNSLREFRGGIDIFEIKNVSKEDASVSKVGGIGMVAGCKSGAGGYKYFYIDGCVEFSRGIPIYPPFNLNGMGLAFYHHMRPKKSTSTTTYLDYVPDKTVLIGFKGMLSVTIQEETLVKGRLVMDAQISSSLGLTQLGLWGTILIADNFVDGFLGDYKNKIGKVVDNFGEKVQEVTNSGLMQKIATANANNLFGRPTWSEAPIAIEAGFLINTQERLFHAQAKAYINFGTFVRGQGKNGHAGGSELYINGSTNTWYIACGRPDSPLGVRLSLAGSGVGFSSYIMMGNKMIDKILPPAEVRKALCMTPIDFMRTADEMSVLSQGVGMAVGGSLEMNQNIDVIAYYLKAKVIVGMDFLHRQKTFACETSKFYGRGNVYGYLSGTFGYRDPFSWFRKKDAISIATPVLLEGGGLNPFYLRGTVTVMMKIGRKSPQYRVFNLTTGTPCGAFNPTSHCN